MAVQSVKRVIAWLLIAGQLLPVQVYANAALVVDNTVPGQRPILNAGGNGVPVVQVVPPNAGGVSHNRFNQYNVGTPGQVLNNSGQGSFTELAGAVGGNPMLAACRT